MAVVERLEKSFAQLFGCHAFFYRDSLVLNLASLINRRFCRAIRFGIDSRNNCREAITVFYFRLFG